MLLPLSNSPLALHISRIDARTACASRAVEGAPASRVGEGTLEAPCPLYLTTGRAYVLHALGVARLDAVGGGHGAGRLVGGEHGAGEGRVEARGPRAAVQHRAAARPNKRRDRQSKLTLAHSTSAPSAPRSAGRRQLDAAGAWASRKRHSSGQRAAGRGWMGSGTELGCGLVPIARGRACARRPLSPLRPRRGCTGPSNAPWHQPCGIRAAAGAVFRCQPAHLSARPAQRTRVRAQAPSPRSTGVRGGFGQPLQTSRNWLRACREAWVSFQEPLRYVESARHAHRFREPCSRARQNRVFTLYKARTPKLCEAHVSGP